MKMLNIILTLQKPVGRKARMSIIYTTIFLHKLTHAVDIAEEILVKSTLQIMCSVFSGCL